jgi:hypothetical protein
MLWLVRKKFLLERNFLTREDEDHHWDEGYELA